MDAHFTRYCYPDDHKTKVMSKFSILAIDSLALLGTAIAAYLVITFFLQLFFNTPVS